jgi:uncharacterized heparinase superfamily protein
VAPDQWLETATRLGIEQAHEQVLADGGHFERSPMYHLHAMDDILALSHLVRDDGKSEDLRSVWMRMAEFQTWMNHPDGNVPLFNDAALNGACLPAEMLRVGCASFGVPELKQRTRGGHMFEDFGMAVCHGERLSVFFDIGQVGPDYQPGHAHADSLTLECSVDGARLFVDPGTLCYERGAERDYDRSTEAHNTVCVDQENSTETWHVFRVGRRARPVDVRCEDTMGEFAVTASHDGYRWKTSRPRHTREVRVSDSGILRIADRIESDDSHHVRGGFLLSPEWSVIASDTRGWTLRGATSSVLVTVDGPPDLCLSVEPREYHPEFHKRVDTDRICWTTSSRSPIEVVVTVTPG